LKSKGYELVEKGESRPYEAKLIQTVSKKQIDQFGTLKSDILFYSKTPYEHQQPVSEIVKIKAYKLYKENAFAENDLLPEKAMLINITDGEQDLYFDNPEALKTDLNKLLFQKNRSAEPVKHSKPHKINNANYEMEIDLHIEELIDNYGGMSNAEIVIIQLRHFQMALDKAINEHYRSLTVIHGVGNGRLKQEVRSILNKMKLRYHDASYSKYGFGATEIMIG
jgi:dsDNA-specific endonuclease/ATPase MutS2